MLDPTSRQNHFDYLFFEDEVKYLGTFIIQFHSKWTFSKVILLCNVDSIDIFWTGN